jgi:hypothetical protein
MMTQNTFGNSHIEKNDNTTVLVGGVCFKNTNIYSGTLYRLLNILQSPKQIIYDPKTNEDIEIPTLFGGNLIHFGKKDICYLGSGRFVVAYDTPFQKETDKKLFAQLHIQTPEVQSPILIGEFELQGISYLILKTEERLMGETNDILYQGVIMEPDKYLEIESDIY